MSVLCSIELARQEFEVALCTRELSVRGEDVSILGVQAVEWCKLPVCGCLQIGIAEVGDLPEYRDLFDELLQAFGVNGEVVVCVRLLEARFLVLLQFFDPVVDNFL